MSTSHATMQAEEIGAARPAPTISLPGWIAIAAAAIVTGLLIHHSVTSHHGDGAHAEAHAPALWGLGIVPFIGILASIAVLPLLPATHHWWESNLNRLGVSLACAAGTIVYYLLVDRAGVNGVVTVLEHAVVAEYIPFIVLLFSLYVISGGISLTGDLVAKPATNTAFLAVGAGIASFIGTTGASMLLIRPILQTNSERKHVVHTVVFFIFLVSNIGGTLLPIGDPPLFLGYLYGVPFFWTLGLWPQWLVCCVILLVVYFVWDTLAYRHETPRDLALDRTHREPLRLRGVVNLLWLGGVVASVAFVVPGEPLPLVGFKAFPFMRELLMLGFVALSLRTTPGGVREANRFNYAAILEVAALFIGIFIAMQVPIAVLKAVGPSLTETMNQPWHFFWATGSLSSFLDNAPTYVVFFELAKTMNLPVDAATVPLAGGAMQIGAELLTAVSLGAVFLGAMTYIGNGPNFMVKAIAEQSGIPMPSFFGYMFRYSLPILVPVFIIVTVVFLL
ncbi:MAG: sodium:proton antiporter [Planctomycetota bacterium]|jgi:Na+/H+ antiporter NhaD/arsenite permease-like protein